MYTHVHTYARTCTTSVAISVTSWAVALLPPLLHDSMAVVWVVSLNRKGQAPRYLIRQSFKPYHELVAEGDDPESVASREYFRPDWSQSPGWFNERMEKSDLEPISNTSEKLEWTIIGAMRLTHRGAIFHSGPVTKWTEEGIMLLETYRDPLDAGIVKIIDAIELSEPIVVGPREFVDERHSLDRLALFNNNVFVQQRSNT